MLVKCYRVQIDVKTERLKYVKRIIEHEQFLFVQLLRTGSDAALYRVLYVEKNQISQRFVIGLKFFIIIYLFEIIKVMYLSRRTVM